jgi:hypothetical protein
MRPVLSALLFLLVATTSAAAEECTMIGNVLRCASGLSGTQVGNVWYFSDGRRGTQVGNVFEMSDAPAGGTDTGTRFQRRDDAQCGRIGPVEFCAQPVAPRT